MIECPVCNKKRTNVLCDCGYQFTKKEIVEEKLIRNWINESSIHWFEKCNRINKVHEIQFQKHGKKTSTSPTASGWSKTDTSKLLKLAKSTVAITLDLYKEITNYPNLQKCRTKSMALNQLKNIRDGYNRDSSFETEEKLHTYLKLHWKETLIAKDWIYETDKCKTQIGEIDFFARHKTENKFLVIELKKEQSSDQAVGQILRYMGYIKHEESNLETKIEGMIISNTFDDYILYASVCVPALKLYKYTYDGKKFQIEEINIDHELNKNQINKMSTEERKTFKIKIENMLTMI